MHWTQTPRGKKLASQRARAYWASLSPKERQAVIAKRVAGRRSREERITTQQEEPQPHYDSSTQTDVAAVSYAAGYVQAWLEGYARSNGLSGSVLARQVGTLLRGSARG